MIYLDSAATTQIDPEVLDEMIDFMRTEYGNPASKYYPQALSAQSYLANSRAKVAQLLNVEQDNIIFTSGASESNNFIIKGIAEKYKKKGKHIITSKIEHKSVLETCKYLEKNGFEVTYLDVNHDGLFDLNQLKKSIRPDTILASLMWVNNEIGVINDMAKVVSICHSENVMVHSDATQAAGKMVVDLKQIPIDFLSMSSHKLYGPKGIGAAFIGNDELGIRFKLPSLIHGGAQEFSMRAGTHAMHDIVGFAKACEIAKRDMSLYVKELAILEFELKSQLVKIIPNIHFHGCQNKKISGFLNFSIPGINNEIFCKQLSNSISFSTGSACTISEGSHVMDSISYYNSDYVRMSLSKYSTKNFNISEFIKLVSLYI